MEFDVDYAPSEAFLGQYFYEKLKQLIKLWIYEDSRELFVWDDFVKKLLRAKAKVKIQNNHDLNQRCHWDK